MSFFRLWKRKIFLVAGVAVCAVVSCTPAVKEPTELLLRGGANVRTEQSCERDRVWDSLSILDAQEYTIDPRAVPDFLVRAGQLSSTEFLIMAISPTVVGECERHTSIRISGTPSAAVSVMPITDWQSTADDRAITAFEQEVGRCRSMSEAVALTTYGRAAVRSQSGLIIEAPDGFGGCLAPILSHSYGFRIDSKNGQLMISSIFDDLFLQE